MFHSSLNNATNFTISQKAENDNGKREGGSKVVVGGRWAGRITEPGHGRAGQQSFTGQGRAEGRPRVAAGLRGMTCFHPPAPSGGLCFPFCKWGTYLGLCEA